LNLKAKILEISRSKTIEIESEMMEGGNMGKKQLWKSNFIFEL